MNPIELSSIVAMVRKSTKSQTARRGAQRATHEARDTLTASEPATLGETATALHLLSAELGHELAYTLQFLQYLVDALEDTDSSGRPMDEIRGFAGREIERMQQVLSNLRRLRLQPPCLADMELLPIVERSTSQLESGIAIDVDVAPHLRVRSDPQVLDAALRHLLSYRNTNRSTEVRISLQADAVIVDRDACVQISISDDEGPFTETSPPSVSNVWNMLPINGPSFHRAVALRLLRSIDGTLEYQRTESGNRFCITLPATRGAL